MFRAIAFTFPFIFSGMLFLFFFTFFLFLQRHLTSASIGAMKRKISRNEEREQGIREGNKELGKGTRN